MHRLRLLVIAVLTASVLLPSAADAARGRARDQGPMALATAVASRFWGADPCQGKVGTIAQQAVPATVERDSDAWVTFDTPLGANALGAPAESYTHCIVALGRARWPTSATMRQDWDMFCMTVTHEFGHLLGHPHSDAPGSIMAPVFADYAAEPQLCRTMRPSGSRS